MTDKLTIEIQKGGFFAPYWTTKVAITAVATVAGGPGAGMLVMAESELAWPQFWGCVISAICKGGGYKLILGL